MHARFQRSFVQLLSNAEFEELSVRDLLLTSSLNTDYLLTLPIYVDWRRASESNAIIYRYHYSYPASGIPRTLDMSISSAFYLLSLRFDT